MQYNEAEYSGSPYFSSKFPKQTIPQTLPATTDSLTMILSGAEEVITGEDQAHTQCTTPQLKHSYTQRKLSKIT